MDKCGYVYILTNQKHTVLYCGVTSDIVHRVAQHKNSEGSRFTRKYKVTILLYYEVLPSIQDAIAREKQIKAGSRFKKLELIQSINPKWQDLYSLLL